MASWCWKVVLTSEDGTLHDECSHVRGLVGNEVALLGCGKGFYRSGLRVESIVT